MVTKSCRTHPMQIERIEEIRLTPADEVAIAKLLDTAFDGSFEGRSYFQNRHHTRLIIRDGNQVIGHMALGLRAIRMEDVLCTAVGLAEVATDPAHRGQGIASKLMQAAIAEARASVADFMILFGDEPLYERAGFVTQPNKTLTISMHGVRTGQQEHRQGDKLMVMPLGEMAWDPKATIDLVGFAF